MIDYIASKKPIILSTGISLEEIKQAIKIIEKYHKKIVILHCVSNYPTKIEDSQSIKIKYLKNKFKKYKIGISDHTNNIFTSLASTLGVCVVENILI